MTFTVYDRLKRAFQNQTGMRLSQEDVISLLSDTAIRDAVYDDYSDYLKAASSILTRESEEKEDENK